MGERPDLDMSLEEWASQPHRTRAKEAVREAISSDDLRAQGFVKAIVVAKKASVSKRRADDMLRELHKDGEVEKGPEGRGWRWRVS